MSKKFKGQIKKDIEAIAASLPKDTYPVGQRVQGSEILTDTKHSAIVEDAHTHGVSIDPSKYYILKGVVQAPVNHLRQLKKAYWTDGRRGVIRYVLPYANEEYKIQLEKELSAYN